MLDEYIIVLVYSLIENELSISSLRAFMVAIDSFLQTVSCVCVCVTIREWLICHSRGKLRVNAKIIAV